MELEDLTWGEKIFISRGFTYTCLRKAQVRDNPANKQLIQQGNTISFPQNSAALLQELPLDSARLPEFIHVLHAGTRETFAKRFPEYKVRRAKVLAALLWLQKHNRIYADIVISDALIAKLPEDGIPNELISAPLLCDLPTVQEEGPATAAATATETNPLDVDNAGNDTSDTDGDFHAAVLDVEGTDIDPLQLWNKALTCSEHITRLDKKGSKTSTGDTPEDQQDYKTQATAHLAIAAEAVASLQTQDAGKVLNQAEDHNIEPTLGALNASRIYANLPHGDTPLDSYQSYYWSACFPLLFPYGDACDGIHRRTFLRDYDWAKGLLLRADRGKTGALRLDLPFVSVLFSTIHRRHLLRVVCVKVRSPTFKKVISTVANWTKVDFNKVAEVIGEHGGVSEAIQSDKVENLLKGLLESMHLVQMHVPCTDGFRTKNAASNASLTNLVRYAASFLYLESS